MGVFKAPQPSFPGKHKPNAGERGHVKLKDVSGTNKFISTRQLNTSTKKIKKNHSSFGY